ncbi:hypothetical protein [Streptomyces geranii]|uniref:hypothetical protein n=1 Tax=Streptomyces geranii TaxID=2058923 RepID=UPI000D03451E|nr:hypothetical protein [Streptomyces geranii]
MRSTSKTTNTERLTAVGVTLAAVLIGFLALGLGMGLVNALSAALIAYVGTVIYAMHKMPVRPTRVVAATTRGTIMGAVIVVIVLIGIYRALRGL